MAVNLNNELESFYEFVGQKLTESDAHSTPEQALAEWRERVETIAAVQDGIRAVDEGRTKSLDEFTRDFRQRHDMPEDG